MVIALKNNPIKINTVSDLSSLKIGLVKQDIGHQLLKQRKINPKAFVFLKTGLQVVKMLFHHRVDVIVYGENIAKSQFERAGISPDVYHNIMVLQESQLGFACNKQTPSNFVSYMQQTLNQYRKSQHSTALPTKISANTPQQ